MYLYICISNNTSCIFVSSPFTEPSTKSKILASTSGQGGPKKPWIQLDLCLVYLEGIHLAVYP